MAKIIDTTILNYYKTKEDQIYVKKSDVDKTLNESSENPVSNKAVTTKLNEIVTAGGEPNKIETIKVNGSPLTPDGSKAVDISVPTNNNQLTNGAGYQNAEQVKTAIEEKGYQTSAQVESAITSKGYQTASQVDSAITSKGYATTTEMNSQLSQYAKKTDISKVMNYCGSVENYSDLPESPKNGDTYNVENADSSHNVRAGDNLTWNGTAWDNLGGIVDLSGYYDKSSNPLATTTDIDAMFA